MHWHELLIFAAWTTSSSKQVKATRTCAGRLFGQSRAVDSRKEHAYLQRYAIASKSNISTPLCAKVAQFS